MLMMCCDWASKVVCHLLVPPMAHTKHATTGNTISIVLKRTVTLAESNEAEHEDPGATEQEDTSPTPSPLSSLTKGRAAPMRGSRRPPSRRGSVSSRDSGVTSESTIDVKMSKQPAEKWGINFSFTSGRVTVTGVLPDSVASQYPAMKNFPLPVLSVNDVDVTQLPKKEFADLIRAASDSLQLVLEKNPDATAADSEPPTAASTREADVALAEPPYVFPSAIGVTSDGGDVPREDKGPGTYNVIMHKNADEKWGLNFNFSGGRVAVTGVIPDSVASGYVVCFLFFFLFFFFLVCFDFASRCHVLTTQTVTTQTVGSFLNRTRIIRKTHLSVINNAVCIVCTNKNKHFFLHGKVYDNPKNNYRLYCRHYTDLTIHYHGRLISLL